MPFHSKTIFLILWFMATLAACSTQNGSLIEPAPFSLSQASRTQADTVTQGMLTESATPSPKASSRSLASNEAMGDPNITAPTVFQPAPDRDLFRLASQLIPSVPEGIPRVVNAQPPNYTVGRTDEFWLIDLEDIQVYQRPFELKLVTPHAYWYVEEGQKSDLADLKRSAIVFEETIYPKITSAFGEEWIPGVDNDPRLNILNGRLHGAAGYYSSSDEYPEAVSPYSNQREIIYINVAAYAVDSENYLEVLAHELQHAVHWRADPTEETWINEGLAELATTIAGYDPDSIHRFLASPPTSLVHWPVTGGGTQASYGAASLFMYYLVQQHGDPTDIKPFLEQPADGIEGIDAYLTSQGSRASFREVFTNWMAANLLDMESGPYSYLDLQVQAQPHQHINGDTTLKSTIPQYAPEYIRIDPANGPLHLTFTAPSENQLLPVDVGPEGCWWSNSGDSIDATLTRKLDLSGEDLLTMEYQVWYDLEEDWDYTYLEVSDDGGETWTIIDTPDASPANPVGKGYGPGYTGVSPGWLDQSIDLSPYAGKEVQVRFQYVTDAAVNGSGLCARRFFQVLDPLTDASPKELSNDSWEPQGFIFTDNRIRQDYVVQVIRKASPVQVETLNLELVDGGNWEGEFLIVDVGPLDELVVAVAALAPKTRIHASYSLTVTAGP